MSIYSFLNNLNRLILNPLILLLFAVAFIYFIYSVIRFLSIDAGDKGTKRIEARNSILWALVGMLIMFSVYGIIRFVLATFGISTSDPAVDFISGRL